MIQITASMVMELRKTTGAGMMDCKVALTENDGDFKKALEFLQIRKKATAAKKAGRIAAEGVVTSYIHMGGRIGVLCEINCETDFVAKTDKFKTFVKDICMHIAATNPQYISKEEFPAEQVNDQKNIFLQQIMEEGKPAELAERIVTGKINKWFKEGTLLEQPFVKDTDKSIREYLEDATADIGEKLSIRRFVRYELGEGLEKRTENFAEEVAAQMGG
ncbi:MAG TPA: translation elongation factor Ts [Myxococcales bacterium]|nr:translation elongation factor Ts [Myxococcales bacterium]HIN85210.1 translation elongation factor Ts [Myxococcales bacterium]